MAPRGSGPSLAVNGGGGIGVPFQLTAEWLSRHAESIEEISLPVNSRGHARPRLSQPSGGRYCGQL